jgi:GntR family transcriptional regulator, transcriptional repressor for pyruvate dehydrogenase complex
VTERLFGLGAVRMPKTADVVAARIRTLTLANRLSPGTPLPGERELIAQLHVSRASVREALRMLEDEGIIEVRRGVRGGIFAAAPSIDRLTRGLASLVAFQQTPLLDLLEMRLLLEPEAAALAAERATDCEREQLLALAEAGQADSMIDHVEFHVLLGVMSGNQLVAIALSALRNIVAESGEAAMLPRAAMRDTLHAHRRIASAIGSANPDLAREATEQHIRAYVEALCATQDATSPIIPTGGLAGRPLSGTVASECP